MTKEEAKELAIVTAYIQANQYLNHNGSFFNTIDQAFEIAEKFVEKFPPVEYNGKWGLDEVGEYEEVLDEFITKNI
jgi:hypothetical protein